MRTRRSRRRKKKRKQGVEVVGCITQYVENIATW